MEALPCRDDFVEMSLHMNAARWPSEQHQKFLLYVLSLPSFGVLFLLSQLCDFVWLHHLVLPRSFSRVKKKLFPEKCNAIELSARRELRVVSLTALLFSISSGNPLLFSSSSFIVYIVNSTKKAPSEIRNYEILLESCSSMRHLAPSLIYCSKRFHFQTYAIIPKVNWDVYLVAILLFSFSFTPNHQISNTIQSKACLQLKPSIVSTHMLTAR